MLVTILRGGAVVFGPGGALIPAELPGPFPVEIELTAPLSPGIEVDSAVVEARNLTMGGHVVEFAGSDLTRRFTLAAGSYTFEVSLEPTIIEKLAPVIAHLMVMAMLGMLVVSMTKGRR